MKKLVLSLLGAATLAISSNALALDTTVPYGVAIQRGVNVAGAALVVPVGVAIFEFDSDIPFTVLPPQGACEYDMEWVNNAGLPLTGECFLMESKAHGANNCIANSMMGVTSFLTNDTTMPCNGFNYFQNYDWITRIQIGESFSPIGHGHGGPPLEGLIQFHSVLLGGSFFGLELQP